MEHACAQLWQWLIGRGLIPQLPPELLIAEVYEMLGSKVFVALSAREQKLAVANTSVVRRIARFRAALGGSDRVADYERALKEAAENDPDHWAWLKEQEQAFRAGTE